MIFSSLDFFVFLAVVLLLLAVVRHQQVKKIILLAASYFFYGYWDARFLLLILFSTIVDYLAGQFLVKTDSPRQRQWLLAASVVTNLGVLGFFKYFNFFTDSANVILGQWGLGVSNLEIILPIGISFYTFQTMSYTIDIYRGELSPSRSFLDFALYVSFFPQLVAGPIVRAKDFLPQLDEKIEVRGLNLWYGGQIFLVGLVKKLLIADTVAPFVDNVMVRPQIFSSFTIWLAVLAYAVQIYGDFSGYSDMAIGSARMMGFNLRQNFNMPYLSANIADFWRRWHISLSSWLRDYLYIPLGGNRRGAVRTYLNLMITMLLGGLWHGASWNFVLWGGAHGLGLSAHRLWRDAGERWGALPTWLGWLLTLLFVLFSWVIFRVQELPVVAIIYGKMLFLNPLGANWFDTPALIAIGLVILGHIAGRRRTEPDLILFPTPFRIKAAFAVTLVVFAIYIFAPTDVAPFIYFQF